MVLTLALLFPSPMAAMQVLAGMAELAAILAPIIGIVVELRRDHDDDCGLMQLLPFGSAGSRAAALPSAA